MATSLVGTERSKKLGGIAEHGIENTISANETVCLLLEDKAE